MNDEQKQSDDVIVLHQARAWNWQWPDERGRWNTGLSPKKGDPKTEFTSIGPSKRTVSRRAARTRRSR